MPTKCDLERFLACYASSVVVENASGERIVEGEDGMRAFYGQPFTNSPELHAEVPSRIRAGDFVIDEERVPGLNRPGFPPEMHAAVVYRVRGGLIVHVRLLV